MLSFWAFKLAKVLKLCTLQTAEDWQAVASVMFPLTSRSICPTQKRPIHTVRGFLKRIKNKGEGKSSAFYYNRGKLTQPASPHLWRNIYMTLLIIFLLINWFLRCNCWIAPPGGAFFLFLLSFCQLLENLFSKFGAFFWFKNSFQIY